MVTETKNTGETMSHIDAIMKAEERAAQMVAVAEQKRSTDIAAAQTEAEQARSTSAASVGSADDKRLTAQKHELTKMREQMLAIAQTEVKELTVRAQERLANAIAVVTQSVLTIK